MYSQGGSLASSFPPPSVPLLTSLRGGVVTLMSSWQQPSTPPATVVADVVDGAVLITQSSGGLGVPAPPQYSLLLDDDVYEEVVSVATLNNMRRNTYLNTMIRDTIESREASAV